MVDKSLRDRRFFALRKSNENAHPAHLLLGNRGQRPEHDSACNTSQEFAPSREHQEIL
jgi:hypothetical protein